MQITKDRYDPESSVLALDCCRAQGSRGVLVEAMGARGYLTGDTAAELEKVGRSWQPHFWQRNIGILNVVHSHSDSDLCHNVSMASSSCLFTVNTEKSTKTKVAKNRPWHRQKCIQSCDYWNRRGSRVVDATLRRLAFKQYLTSNTALQEAHPLSEYLLSVLLTVHSNLEVIRAGQDMNTAG